MSTRPDSPRKPPLTCGRRFGRVRGERRAFTLIEVLLVITVLLIVAAVILPSIGAFRGDTRLRAAADSLRGELALARSRAMEEGRPYRVALSADKTRIRRAPDTAEFAQTGAADVPGASTVAVDYAFEYVTAEVVGEDGGAPEPLDGWVTVVTVLPDGSCQETTALVVITEPGNGSLWVRVRGLTASSRVVPGGK